MTHEFELKLLVKPARLARVANAPWLRQFATGRAESLRLESVYYDTKKLALQNHRATLRVRKIGTVYFQTFKGETAAGGLDRLEWERPLTNAKPKLKDARKKKTGGVELRKLTHALMPVFKTDVMRRTVPLNYHGSRIELAVDTGQIQAGNRSTPIHEVELELKRGNPASIVALGREVASKLDAAYGIASKADRGYALRKDELEAPVCAVGIRLSEKMTAAQAFRAIAMACVHHFAGNEKAVLAEKAEGVHQMRVGLRRLRATISVFKHMLAGPETEAIKNSLKWMTDELGPARDMDVMQKEAIGPMAKTSLAPKAVAALKEHIVAKRDGGFARAKKAAASDRFRHLVLETVLWINGGKWTTTRQRLSASNRDVAAKKYAARQLRRRTKKVLKTLAKVDYLKPLDRHRLRIAVKKLRYATGYFESLFGGEKAVKKFSTLLEKLQSSLGQLNDIRVHAGMAKDYARPGPVTRRAVKRAFAMGELSGTERGRGRELVKAAKHHGKRLERCTTFWA